MLYLKNGESKIEGKFQIGLDMTDKWLSIAEQNTAKAVEAGRQLDLEWPSGNDSAAVPHLEAEFFYSIQAICASAFAIDVLCINKGLNNNCSNSMANINPILEAWESRYGKLFERKQTDHT